MNMKEQLRVEIRKELHILEMKCLDMASLLRGLGIQVGGCPYPLPHEVSCIYIYICSKLRESRDTCNLYQQFYVFSFFNISDNGQLSFQVHAAYKRALLKFHPDRASKTDIRQQVEAEEKFKLISRMKEKFLANSYY